MTADRVLYLFSRLYGWTVLLLPFFAALWVGYMFGYIDGSTGCLAGEVVGWTLPI